MNTYWASWVNEIFKCSVYTVAKRDTTFTRKQRQNHGGLPTIKGYQEEQCNKILFSFFVFRSVRYVMADV